MRTCVFTLALPFFLLRGLKTFDKLLLKLEIYRSYFFCFVVFFRVVKNVHKYNNHCLCVLWAFIFFYHTIALWMQCGEERAVCTNIKNQYFFLSNIEYTTLNIYLEQFFVCYMSTEIIQATKPLVVLRMSISFNFFPHIVKYCFSSLHELCAFGGSLRE